MSFAQRFAAGQQIAKGLIDTYQTGKRNKELGAVADWKKSDEYEGYTPQDAEQMHAIANAKDANGNPYYQMQDDGKGGLRVQSNFSYAGADGAEVAPGAQVGLAPRKVVDYGGQRYANEELTPERMTALQDRERANIIGRYDPEAGLKMRRQLSQDERETKRFGWEEQGQPLKQRAAELQVESGERGERAGQRTEEVQKIVDQVAAMPEDALKVYAAKLNTNESTLPFLMVGESKSGYKFLTIDPKTGTPTGNEFTLNSSQMRQMAAASVLGMMGKGQESMALLSEVNKDVAKAVADMNGVTASVVGSQNFALKAERGDEQDEARTNIAAQGLALRRAAAARQANLDRLGRLLPMEGPDGKATFGEAVLVNGVPTLRPVDMGALRVPGKPLDQKAVVDTAIKLVESGFPNPNAPKEPLDMPTALAIAAAQLSGRPYVSEQQKLIDAYTAAKTAGPPTNTQQSAPTTPQGRGLFTDRHGQTQLLEPLTRFGEFNRRLQDETNQNLGY